MVTNRFSVGIGSLINKLCVCSVHIKKRWGCDDGYRLSRPSQDNQTGRI